MEQIAEQRSWLEALSVHAQVRAKHAAKTWMFLKPFLTKHISAQYARPFPTHPAPDIGFLRYLAIKLLWLNAAFFQQNRFTTAAYGVSGMMHLAHLGFAPLEKSVVSQLRKKGKPDPIELPIPEYDWENGSPEEFVEQYMRRPFPVVLRGFSKASGAVENFKFDTLLERFGHEKVLLTTRDKDGFEGELGQVRDPKVYCHNSEFLFIRYPELKESLGFDRLVPYSDGKKEAYSQLFIGRKGTGTPLHCAAVWNWFHMLDGKKKWYFIDPVHSLFLYPVNRMGQVAATSHCSYPDRYNKAAYPMFEFCPYYSVTLEPGDVLLNPPWWWHAIDNITEESVAVASRWHIDGVVGRTGLWTEEDYDINRFFSTMLQLGIESPLTMQQMLQHPSPTADGHMTIREKKNRFVDRHYKIANEKILGIFHKI